MKYKSLVLKRFPNAKPVVLLTYPSGDAYRVVIFAGDDLLDVNYHRGDAQGYQAAWRSAYFWCVRNPRVAQ